MDENDALARFGLGKALLEAGQADEAAVQLTRAVEIDSNYTAAYVILAKALDAAGQKDAARETCKKGIEVGRKTGDLEPVRQMETHLMRLDFKGPKTPSDHS